LADNTLLITPADPQSVPQDPAALLHDLRQQGLIGAALDPQSFADSYAVGEAYPRLLSFMGCSPYFKTEAEHPADRDFCHLQLLGPWLRPRLLGRIDEATPRCPGCGKLDRQWRRQSAQPAADEQWQCPHCGHHSPWGALSWRQRAGFARLALVLHHVHEGEAVPGPELLKLLQQHSGGPWSWFYA
jgi:hypothetical protein